MLLVIFGHTITGSTADSQKSFLFAILWSLQMPLFILISGYVTRYSKPITDFSELFKKIRKRTMSYLLPWAIWSFFVRGVVCQQKQFLDIRWLVFHMDSGYCFLFTIWTIVIIYSISQYIASKLSCRKEKAFPVFEAGAYLLCMGILVGIGLVFGMSFLGVKLTLYYMPIFYLGRLYGRYQESIFQSKQSERWTDFFAAGCFIVWILAITRVNFYYADDTVFIIAIRMAASLTGCIAICSMLSHFNGHYNGITWIGQNSIGIYLSHNLFLNLIRAAEHTSFASIQGAIISAVNFSLTIAMSVMFVLLINNNSIMRALFLGKRG